MSRITKMKYVAAETTMDYSLPTPDQTICRVLKVLGNSTFLVAPPEGEAFIASMPPKFRRHIYVKRNGFVITEPIPEGKKVRGEIVRILQRNQIKHFYQENVWPKAFDSTVYLDNTFSSLTNHRLTDQSDRGIVHGEKFFFMDGEKCRAVNKGKDPSTGASSAGCPGASFDVDSYPSIEPNYNKKAVTWIVFSDDESEGEESSDDGEEGSDDGEESSGDGEESSGDGEESGEDAEKSGGDAKETGNDEDTGDEESDDNDEEESDLDEKERDDEEESNKGKEECSSKDRDIDNQGSKCDDKTQTRGKQCIDHQTVRNDKP